MSDEPRRVKPPGELNQDRRRLKRRRMIARLGLREAAAKARSDRKSLRRCASRDYPSALSPPLQESAGVAFRTTSGQVSKTGHLLRVTTSCRGWRTKRAVSQPP